MIKLIIITGSSLRHKFFSSYFNNQKNIKLLCSFEEFESFQNNIKTTPLINLHNKFRIKNEVLSFKNYIKKSKKFKSFKISKGEINNPFYINKIIKMKPDLIIGYGCSIIKPKLINKFKKRFLNIHLGLSPYYKGSGTNFFPFVEKELQFLGATLMFIDKGIDTGKIIHQIRPKLYTNDNIQTIGNRIIKKITKDTAMIVSSNKPLRSNKLVTKYNCKTFKKKDFNDKALIKANNSLKNNIIRKYLLNKKKLEKKFPIVEI